MQVHHEADLPLLLQPDDHLLRVEDRGVKHRIRSAPSPVEVTAGEIRTIVPIDHS